MKNGNGHDPVNHPQHYTQGTIEVIEFIEDQKLPYHLGNVIKYVCRAGKKDATLQDLRKAAWYLDRYIKLQQDGEPLAIVRVNPRRLPLSETDSRKLSTTLGELAGEYSEYKREKNHAQKVDVEVVHADAQSAPPPRACSGSCGGACPTTDLIAEEN